MTTTTVEHTVTYTVEVGPGGSAHLARCTCGWMDATSTRAAAEQSASEHTEGKGPRDA